MAPIPLLAPPAFNIRMLPSQHRRKLGRDIPFTTFLVNGLEIHPQSFQLGVWGPGIAQTASFSPRCDLSETSAPCSTSCSHVASVVSDLKRDVYRVPPLLENALKTIQNATRLSAYQVIPTVGVPTKDGPTQGRQDCHSKLTRIWRLDGSHLTCI